MTKKRRKRTESPSVLLQPSLIESFSSNCWLFKVVLFVVCLLVGWLVVGCLLNVVVLVMTHKMCRFREKELGEVGRWMGGWVDGCY